MPLCEICQQEVEEVFTDADECEKCAEERSREAFIEYQARKILVEEDDSEDIFWENLIDRADFQRKWLKEY